MALPIAAALLLGIRFLFASRPVRDLLNLRYWTFRLSPSRMYDADLGLLRHGNVDLPEIALTIDDGPHERTGTAILDILRRERVRATFFVVGRRMKERPSLVRRMLAEGHEVANHTMNHLRLDRLDPQRLQREVVDCDRLFQSITGLRLRLLRPPGMRLNRRVLAAAKELGCTVVSWNVAAKDYNVVSPDYIVRKVLEHVENGSIILLHDDRPGTVFALEQIIPALKRRGFQFRTVSEMLAHLPNPVIAETNARAPARIASHGKPESPLFSRGNPARILPLLPARLERALSGLF